MLRTSKTLWPFVLEVEERSLAPTPEFSDDIPLSSCQITCQLPSSITEFKHHLNQQLCDKKEEGRDHGMSYDVVVGSHFSPDQANMSVYYCRPKPPSSG